MEYINIDFPFSSINDNQYHMALILNGADTLGVRDALKQDKEVFTAGGTRTVGGETVYDYTGTLTGAVKAIDDERSDFLEPLVQSKLSFNMAVQTFPDWLMPYCNTNRAHVIVYFDEDGKTFHEMWRGYLVAQSLNMTVVNNLLSVALVAVDEVAMAKYMNFKATTEYVTNDHWCTLFGLMQHYFNLHYERGFDSSMVGFNKLYQMVGLSSTKRMLWHRDMRIVDDDDNTVTNLPQTFVVNLDRWLQDEEATWSDVLDDICRYLCVTFAIGSYGLMTVNDAYLLTCPNDLPSYTQYVYILDTGSYTTHSYDVYTTLSNPQKVGANFQVTAEPERYKEVVVTSEPERWKGHDYLTDEHYKEIDKTKYVRYQWGTTEDPTNGPFGEFGWHKLRYLKPDAEEADFVEIAPCQNGEGYQMARDGVLPYDNLSSCDGKTEPDASVADSLDFITFKEGCCCIKMGGGEIGGIDEDSQLKPYFLILNHMWGNMVNETSHTMSSTHIADTPWLTFRPLGAVAGVHPGDKHYLTIGMSVMFIRENMPIGSTVDGNSNQHNWFVSPGVGQSMVPITWASPAILLPCDSTVFAFDDPNGPYHGAYYGGLSSWNSLYFTAYIRVGNLYFNGTNWVAVGSGETPPKCNVTMHNSTTETTEVDKYGYRSLETANYYYTVSNPYRGNNSVDRENSPKMIVSMDGLSIHGQPVQGQLEIQILGQIRFQSTNGASSNSIPFVLVSDVEINYTDDAEIMDTDIKNEEKVAISALPTLEDMQRDLKMATPSVGGFFNNALLFDGGKAWHNVTAVVPQSYSMPTTPERMIARKLADQYSGGQFFVEFDTPVNFDDNIHNVCFSVQNLTEADGRFLPVKREFDYTRETMRVKMQRINTKPIN